MDILYSEQFLKSASRLPLKLRQRLGEHLELLKGSPFHPKLHTKHLSGDLAGLLSFRVTRDWRVTFRFIDARTIHVMRVANRKDIYR